MGHRKKRETGPQQHAEGQHGGKTHQRFIEQLHEPVAPSEERESAGKRIEGHHRLNEERQQHDPAEKNSEAVK